MQFVPIIHSKFDVHVLIHVIHGKHTICGELRPSEKKQPENRGVFVVGVVVVVVVVEATNLKDRFQNVLIL